MDAPPGMIVTITDIRLAGFCASGVRNWFEGYGLDFRSLLKNGITAEDLLATGDARAIQVVERKLQREAEVPADLVITIDDVRTSRKCTAGAREWAAKRGFDYAQFLEGGVPASVLVESGDPDARQVVIDRMARDAAEAADG